MNDHGDFQKRQDLALDWSKIKYVYVCVVGHSFRNEKLGMYFIHMPCFWEQCPNKYIKSPRCVTYKDGYTRKKNKIIETKLNLLVTNSCKII